MVTAMTARKDGKKMRRTIKSLRSSGKKAREDRSPHLQLLRDQKKVFRLLEDIERMKKQHGNLPQFVLDQSIGKLPDYDNLPVPGSTLECEESDCTTPIRQKGLWYKTTCQRCDILLEAQEIVASLKRGHQCMWCLDLTWCDEEGNPQCWGQDYPNPNPVDDGGPFVAAGCASYSPQEDESIWGNLPKKERPTMSDLLSVTWWVNHKTKYGWNGYFIDTMSD
jgi:hypothetical protein